MKSVHRIAHDLAIEAIRQARARQYLLHIVMYCQSDACPAREIDIYVKDHDQALLPLIGDGMCCPVCGRQRLRLQSVQTRRERQIADEREARCSVNRQLRRAKLPPGALLAESVADILDDSLPVGQDGDQ
jgi:hypothetical protein